MSGAVIYSVLIIALITALTFGARALPFLLFSRGGQTPGAVVYLGNILPPAVIVLLVVYCLRTVDPLTQPHGLPELIGLAAVALLYKFSNNNLVAIVGGTVIYMILIQKVFI